MSLQNVLDSMYRQCKSRKFVSPVDVPIDIGVPDIKKDLWGISGGSASCPAFKQMCRLGHTKCTFDFLIVLLE